MNHGNILTAELVGEEVVTCIDYDGVRHVTFSLTVVRTYPFNACPHRVILREPPYSSVAHYDFKKKALSASLTSSKPIHPPTLGCDAPRAFWVSLSLPDDHDAKSRRRRLLRGYLWTWWAALFWAFQEFRRGEVSERSFKKGPTLRL